MAKQMTERARWTLSEVFDNPDYNVAQALYVLALHVLYYEVRSHALTECHSRSTTHSANRNAV